jgi:hypothetical protein
MIRFVDVLRWIGVLPISIIAWIVSYWVITLLNVIFSPVEMSSYVITLLSSGGSGFAFVYIGSIVAPKGNKVVSIVLATIMVIFALASFVTYLYGYGDNSMLLQIISTLATILGCIFASIKIGEL